MEDSRRVEYGSFPENEKGLLPNLRSHVSLDWQGRLRRYEIAFGETMAGGKQLVTELGLLASDCSLPVPYATFFQQGHPESVIQLPLARLDEELVYVGSSALPLGVLMELPQGDWQVNGHGAMRRLSSKRQLTLRLDVAEEGKLRFEDDFGWQTGYTIRRITMPNPLKNPYLRLESLLRTEPFNSHKLSTMLKGMGFSHRSTEASREEREELDYLLQFSTVVVDRRVSR